MALALVQKTPDGAQPTNGPNADAVSTPAFTGSVTVGNLLVAVVSSWPVTTEPTFEDDGGNTWQIDHTEIYTGIQRITIASAMVATGGSGITVTATGVVGMYWYIGAYELTDVPSSDWVDNAKGAQANSANISTGALTVGAGNKLYIAGGTGYGNTEDFSTVWSPTAQLHEGISTPSLIVDYLLGTGTQTAEWDMLAAHKWQAAIVAYKEDTGGPTGNPYYAYAQQ